ncbi:uncharacterized mitochondrial protein AtMg00810-like [Telopea speciosissima]|uniref:uncharacterized mitochondrial protein AtMg00810-like n=1 Tax=Telopea speciosissima TaxID=54955 RepID=UPI001CC40F8E|nr:uncharacterized mitochondrial protein AtMg00810-like [Telopea speciosissima]
MTQKVTGDEDGLELFLPKEVVVSIEFDGNWLVITKVSWIVLSQELQINPMSNNFAMSDLGDLHYFLGIEAKRNSQGMLLPQTKYALDLLKRTGMTTCRPINSPVATGNKLSSYQGEPLSDPHEYRQIVGALQYLTMTRPDISYAVNQLTLGVGITVKSSSLNLLGAYTDADWVGCPNTRFSTTGFCTFLGTNLLSWGSKKQPTVSRSSAEAEYKALAVTVSELLWLSYLLRDLHRDVQTPILVYCDSLSAT